MDKISFLIFFSIFFLFFKIVSIFYTQHNLFGDEAQYWLWSTNLDLGYFSKPPLLSWVVFLVCSFFGNSFFDGKDLLFLSNSRYIQPSLKSTFKIFKF